MTSAPEFLAPDGRASMATWFLFSHFGLRRDAARLVESVRRLGENDAERARVIGEGWTIYKETILGHHTVEDTGVFPQMRAQHAELIAVMDQLAEDHRVLHEVLDRVQAGVTGLPASRAAAEAALGELVELLATHLGREEEHVVPLLRDAKTELPAEMTSGPMAEVVAGGFSWSTEGVAPDVVETALAALPESIKSKLPAARATYEARCERLWAGIARPGGARTAIPGR